MDFPLEMFSKTRYRVVRSHEEKQAALKEGWTAEKPADHPYVPVSAPPDPVVPVQPTDPFKRGPGRPPLLRDKAPE